MLSMMRPSLPNFWHILVCRSILEYADVLWDPADAALIQELEAVQNKAIRFVKSIKGRHGITEGRTSLGLQELKDRRKSHRFALMTKKILSEDEKHAVLSSAYSEIVNDRNQMSTTTRAAARGEPIQDNLPDLVG